MWDHLTSMEKWLSSLSEEGVDSKVFDSTIDLEEEWVLDDKDSPQQASTPAGAAVTPGSHAQAPPLEPQMRQSYLDLAPCQEEPAPGQLPESPPQASYPFEQAGSPAPVPGSQWDKSAYPAQPIQPAPAAPVTAPPRVKKEKPVVIIADKYQVVSCLGKGVMCEVFKAKSLASGQVVMLKLLPREAWNDKAAIERFYQEAEIIIGLNHNNLIPFSEFGVTKDGQPYLVTSALHGITLSRAIRSTDGLPLPRVVQVAEQICRGLQACHAEGIVHRDVRPDNIMFLSKKGDYHLKLVDFGIAKLISCGIEPMEQLRTTGDIAGSPPYMSPEECLGKEIDARSDIYSLGCVMYTAMTGKPPFAGSSSAETLKKQVWDPLPPPSKIKRTICSAAQAGWVTVADLEHIVMRCLEKSPEDRYQSIEEVLNDLEKLRQQIPLTTPQHKQARGLRTAEVDIPKPEDKRKSLIEMMGAVFYIVIAVAIFLASGLFLLNANTHSPAKQPATSESIDPAKEKPKSNP